MEINQEIKDSLRHVGVELGDGIPYLLARFYGYNPSYVPGQLKTKIASANIFKEAPEEPTGVQWLIPLVEGHDIKFDWVKDWMEMFAEVNPKRKGVKKTAIARMKKFFAKNPEYRREDVIEATQMYIDSLNNPDYIVTSHYFISKGSGADRVSLLLEWCEKLEVARRSREIRRSITNTMQ